MPVLRWLMQKAGAFEIESQNRLLPMEGVRGIAVTLVFLQHYCTQFQLDGRITGGTAAVASAFRNYGNHGVELFFVLSGFLIYGILLRKAPGFFDFMGRRAQRLYPAFLVALGIAWAVDHFRPIHLVPSNPIQAAIYFAENIAFLPGLFPITPLSAVNWSLSYEWWFYASCTLLFVVIGLRKLPSAWRVALIGAIMGLVLLLSAFNIPNVPVRGISLLTGMLLAEASRANLGSPNPVVAACLVGIVFAATLTHIPGWLVSLLLAASFGLFCSAAFFKKTWLSAALSWSPLRWLGNISYSFYLVHGFVVVTALHFLGHIPQNAINTAFWWGLFPLFAAAFAFSACLFLAVEKPLSLNAGIRHRAAPHPSSDDSIPCPSVEPAPATPLPDESMTVATSSVNNAGSLSAS